MKLFLITTVVLMGSTACNKESVLPSGNEKLTKIETYDPTTQSTSVANYNYDSNGRLIEIAGSGGNGTNEKQLLAYDNNGKIVSNTLTNNSSGDKYRFDFLTDGNGRIIKSNCTSFIPNFIVFNSTYTYDAKSRIIIDSVFNKSGSVHSYVKFDYDNNDNVIAYQQYVNDGTAIVLINRMTFQYDTKFSPYYNIGQVLYTSFGGGGNSFFYLSKNNPTSATLNGTTITPGGNFVYQYYPNSLLRTSTVNVPNTIKFTFYYTE